MAIAVSVDDEAVEDLLVAEVAGLVEVDFFGLVGWGFTVAGLVGSVSLLVLVLAASELADVLSAVGVATGAGSGAAISVS